MLPTMHNYVLIELLLTQACSLKIVCMVEISFLPSKHHLDVSTLSGVEDACRDDIALMEFLITKLNKIISIHEPDLLMSTKCIRKAMNSTIARIV